MRHARASNERSCTLLVPREELLTVLSAALGLFLSCPLSLSQKSYTKKRRERSTRNDLVLAVARKTLRPPSKKPAA